MQLEGDFDTDDLSGISKLTSTTDLVSLASENTTVKQNEKTTGAGEKKEKAIRKAKLKNKQQTAKVIALDAFRRK